MSSDRTRTRDRSADAANDEFDFEIGASDEATTEGTSDGSSGLRGRAAERARTLFSPRHFAAALLLTVGGLFAASTLVPLPGAGFLGVFGAAFLFGLAVEGRRYAEPAVAGGVAATASTLLDFAVVAFLGGFGVSLAIAAGALGVVVGAVGTYFGRDLRAGLTRDVP
jgi:hypothetical protein